jgi:hypothetical protein
MKSSIERGTNQSCLREHINQKSADACACMASASACPRQMAVK